MLAHSMGGLKMYPFCVIYNFKGQCHRDLVLFQNPQNVFRLTETVK